ncbi:lysosomal beta glucosidase-like protein [Corchorus olitorius]|uniref:Lysosomal beta glucosidase-like protein n=1 Tax=Corchorus olitorius TaxID=93759 RepID=A0A1R3GY28_9ROSI|nr:lysosomal beta glucosidase-like protein [Corchorus olitorius]
MEDTDEQDSKQLPKALLSTRKVSPLAYGNSAVKG